MLPFVPSETLVWGNRVASACAHLNDPATGIVASGADRHDWAPTNSDNLYGGDGGVRVCARECARVCMHACMRARPCVRVCVRIVHQNITVSRAVVMSLCD